MTAERVRALVPSLENLIHQRFDTGGVPGLAVGVVSHGGLEWFTALGARDLISGEPADSLTLFRVASVTKTFTATAIIQLRDAGMLGLDDPLLVHIPEFTVVNARRGTLEGVTLRRLLTHQSGLVTEPPTLRWDQPYFPSQAEILESLADVEVVIPQDYQWKYSNLAYALLGVVVERITGRPYTDYLQQEILDPLDLRYTVLEPGADLKKRVAVGYSPVAGEGGFRKAPYVSINGMSPCGQLHSNIHDLAKWVGFQFNGQLDGRSTVLAPSSLAEMHRPQYMDPGWKSAQGLGWRLLNVDGELFNHHGGGIHGFATNIVFHHPSRTGVIVCANAWPAVWPYDLAVELAKIVADAVAVAEPEKESPPNPALREYAGDYWAEPGIPVTVELQGDSIHIPPPRPGEYLLHRPATMDRESGDAFRVRGGRAAGELVVFSRHADGTVSGFKVGGFFYARQS